MKINSEKKAEKKSPIPCFHWRPFFLVKFFICGTEQHVNNDTAQHINNDTEQHVNNDTAQHVNNDT